jgi:undecaprenyl diphosphate synthase
MTKAIPMPHQQCNGLHVAVIMDGNGRWAIRRGLPRIAGHRAGVIAARRIVERAATAGIGRLTLYAFSSDNWRRPSAEVQGIFRLLGIFLRKDVERLRRHGIRFQVIGRRDRLPPALLREIENAETITLPGQNLRLCVAIDYSSRDAITSAVAKAAALSTEQGMPLQEAARRVLTQTLTGDGAAVDLLIRTGGEKRLSDFLLWESAYAELFFTDRMWPEFTESDFNRALRDFSHRDRRFGGVPVSTPHAEPASLHTVWRLRS